MKQTFLSFLLMLVPMLANADAVEIDGIWYNLVPKIKEAAVSYNPNKYKGNVVIPSTIEYNGVNYTVTSINGGAFTGCRDIISITIPNTVNTIGAEVFDTGNDNIPLYSIYISDLEAWCNMNFLESYYYTLAPYRLFLNGEEVKNLEIPNTINTIKYNSFSNCVSIESVTIPSSITLIEERAFDGCTSLSSVHIADLDSWCRIVIHSNPLATAQHLYMNNEEIKDLIIPNGVTSIGKNAFWGCSGLTSVTIPNSVTSIGEYAFFCCSGLESVHISDLAAWCNIIFDDNPLPYAHHLYLGNSEISELVIPNSVERIGNGLFSGCKSLTSVTIPNSVTSIGNYAFSSCSSLTSVTIPNSVTSIGSNAFYNCGELMDVYCLAEKLINDPNSSEEGLYTYPDAFQDSYPEVMTLHVPASAIETYKATEPWCYFKEIVPIENTDDNDDAYIDLGLPSGTKWATMNVGATNPEDPGDIFAWAETDAKTSFTENNYKYGTSLTDMTKYNSNDGLTVLEASDDAATANMGADWRTPTVAEWRELRDKCTRTWMTVNGKTGYQFTGPNGNKIFLPCGFDNFWGNGAGYYWSSSLSSEYVTAAWNVDFDKGGFYIDHKEPTGFDHRYTGRNIRAVYGNTTVTPPTQKCATPTISYSGGKLRFTCETPDVEFFYDISSADDKNGKGSEVDVTPVYHINVYASKEGYLDSDVASADINMACEDSQSSPIVGDLNGDGKVNVADHVELSKIILNQ